MEIEIEYCVPCGLLGAAEEVGHAVLSRFGERIGGVRMTPGHGGVFRVSVDGTLVFDKSHDGFDIATIVERVSERARPGQALGSPRRR